MKRKLLSILLALTMCVGLAIPAFAEPAEELPAPEETEALPSEEVQDIPDLAMENGESEWVMGEVCYGHVHWLEDYNYEEPLDGTEETEESIVEVEYGYICFDTSCQSLMLASDTTPNDFAPESIIPPYDCGNHKWGSGTTKFTTKQPIAGDPDFHRVERVVWHLCVNDERCTVIKRETIKEKVEPPVEEQDVTEPEEAGEEVTYYAWDSEFDYTDGDLVSWTWVEEEMEGGVNCLRLYMTSVADPAMVDAASATPANEGNSCITHLGKPEVVGHAYEDKETYHKVYDVIKVECFNCGETITRRQPTGEEPHSWEKDSFVGYRKVSATAHLAVYRYLCICGAKDQKGDSESHSLDKYDFGSNYHKGALHYVEWYCVCNECGYQTTKWESQPCPGNNNGEGCIFGINKVEPPVEELESAPAEKLSVSEETPTLADLIAAGGAPPEDGTYVMLGREYGHFHADEDRDFDAEAAGILGNAEVTEGYVVLRPSYGRLCSDISCPYNATVAEMLSESISTAESLNPGVCPYCKQSNWGSEGGGIVDYKIRSVDENCHAESYIFLYICKTEGCGGYCRIPVYREPYEPHSWKKGSLNGYQSNSSTHTAVYNYSCSVCGETKTEGESAEAHTWSEVGSGSNSCAGSNHTVTRTYKCKCNETKTETTSLMKCSGYTGDNYHSGKLHYVGYGYYCTVCGYSETRYESMSCPGNNKGEGCVFCITHKTEPPVEEQDVTEPEDVDIPGESEVPEETNAPDDGESVE